MYITSESRGGIMSIAISNQPESFSDKLALNIKILQIIEKHNLRVNFSNQDRYILNGDNNSFYDHNGLKDNFIMAVSLPITKQELQGENFSGSALEDFLNIEEIINDPVTEVINLEARGEDFQVERYHAVNNLGKTSFNLVDKEKMATVRYGSSASFFVFEEGKPQINLYIRFDPIFMLLNNSTYYYEQEIDGDTVKLFRPLKLADNSLNASVLQSYMSDGPDLDTGVLTMYSLYTLYLLAQQHNLGLTGSFKDLIYFEPRSSRSGTRNLPQGVNGVQYRGTCDLNKEQLDILLIRALNKNPYTINAHRNGINPLDTRTYSRFLFQSPVGIKSLSAFEILPETDTVKNIIEIKQDFLNINNFSILRTSLFLPKKIIDIEDYPELTNSYRDWVIQDTNKLKERWDKIITRSSKYKEIGFVPRIVLAINFIKKYIWSHYKYQTNIISGNSHIPIVFRYLIDNMGIKPEEFFGMEGYQNYFDGFHKINLDRTEFSNNRFEKMTWTNINNQLYFPYYRTSEVYPSSINRGSYNALTHIIINDSYTKQAWKKKVKEYITTKKLYDVYSKVLILTTANKLETMMLVRVLKDRPFVTQFSKFIKDVPKAKRVKQIKIIKTLVLDSSNVREINRRKHWSDSGSLSDYDITDNLFVIYAQRKGFYFGGKFHDPVENIPGLVKWLSMTKEIYKKKIVFITEKDFKDIREAHPDMVMLDEFTQTSEFSGKANDIINPHIYLDNPPDQQTLVAFIGAIQDYFMKSVYTGLANDSRQAEHIFYQFLDLIPNKNLQSVILKSLPYFRPRVDAYGYSSWSFTNFFKALPNRESFDYDIFQSLAKEREVVFTQEEISSAQSAVSRVRSNRSNSEFDSLATLLHDLEGLRTKSNIINLNQEDRKMINEARMNIYLVDLVRLLLLLS